MRRYPILALMALAAAPGAAPGMASVERPGSPMPAGNPVDWLYPEIPVEDDSWRGLLPVILLDTEALADPPAPASARNEQRK